VTTSAVDTSAVGSASTPFVIAGTQRTGTTLVRTSLSSHPRILCHGEVFKLGKRPYTHADGYWAYTRRSPAARLCALAAPQRSTARFLRDLYGATGHAAVGFKLMLSHCAARPYLWPLVRSYTPKVVFVRRENVLKTLLSRLAAAASGIYHLPASTAGAAPRRSPRLHVDVRSLVANLEAIESEPRQWRELLRGLPVLEIVYEDYVRTLKATNDRMLEFLGVEAIDLASDLQKINADNLAQLIDNHAEVAAALTGTRFAVCLDAG
jgi:LPS sulfotransferase NodH